MVESRAACGSYRSLVMALAVLLAYGVAGCSLPFFGSDEKVEIWRSSDQFVRIEPQDRVNGRVPEPNSHPVRISRERISGALGQILVKHSPKAKAAPLFRKYDLKILGTSIEEGLAKAGPKQDVTFAIVTWSSGLFGLKQPKVITGRVFYLNGQLNLIFGSLLRDGPMHEGYIGKSAKNPDIRLNPYVPGLRSFSVKNNVILVTPPGSGVRRARGVNRSDWLVFGVNALVARPAATGKVKKSPAPAARSGEYQQLRRELEQLKQRLERQQPGAYPPAQPYPAPAPQRDLQSVEQRLAVLDNLRKRGLISEQEYQSKRNKILQGF